MNKEISPVGTFVGEVGTMPGTTGFTMACFKAADVPFGTKLYINTQPEQQPERRLYEATRDAAVETLLDLGYSYFGRMQWNPPSKAPEPSVTEELFVPSSKVLDEMLGSPDELQDLHRGNAIVLLGCKSRKK